MKKIFTLLFALGILTLAQAQPGYGNNRQNDQRDFNRSYDKGDNNFYNNDYRNNDRRYDGDDNFSFGRNRQIDRINREYDFKIERVRRNFFLSRHEKQERINMLQEQREREIRSLYYGGHDRDDRFGDHDRRDRW